jgi:hypothetical protein
MKIIQPGVAAIKSRLRRVTDQKIINPERVASNPHPLLVKLNCVSFQQFPQHILRRNIAMMPASYAAQSARDWRMISSSSALESPPPKVKVPVRCRQPSRVRP